MRRYPVGHCHRRPAQRDNQKGEAETQHRPVERDAPVWVDRPDRPDRGQRRQQDRHRHRQQRPGHHRADDTDEPVADSHCRRGPQRSQDRAVLGVAAHQAADHLTADHQRGERRDQPEHPEGDGLGPDRPLRLRHLRGTRLRPAGLPEGRRDLRDGRQHRRLVPRPAIELQRNVGVIGAARLQPPGQRRGDHRQLITQSRVIVLHDLRVKLNDADQPQRDHQVRLVRRIPGER